MVVPEALWAMASGAYSRSPADTQAADAAPPPLHSAHPLEGSQSYTLL